MYSLKYKWSTTSGYNDLGIRKLRFMIIEHLLCINVETNIYLEKSILIL